MDLTCNHDEGLAMMTKLNKFLLIADNCVYFAAGWEYQIRTGAADDVFR